MKTTRLCTAFSPSIAFEVGCKSSASRACRRAAEWQAARAGMEAKQEVPEVMELGWQGRWPVDQESLLDRGAPPNKVEINTLTGRPL